MTTRTHRFSSITGPLMSLHWLPVKSCVQFKLGLITYIIKGYKNKYPAYLENHVQPYRNIYHTRRNEPAHHMLSIPHYKYKQHKSFRHLSNSFFCYAPRLWNSLPETCRCASSLGLFHADWRHISGQSHSRHSCLSYKFSWLVPDLFSDHGLWIWLSLWFVHPECVFNAD